MAHYTERLQLPTTPLQFTPLEKTKAKQSTFWRGFKVVVNFIYETPVYVLGIAVAGLVAHFFFPFAACSLFAHAGAIMTTKIVVKIAANFQLLKIDNLVRKCLEFKLKHRFLPIIAFGGVLLVSYFIVAAGVICSLALGIFNGITAEAEHRKKLLELDPEHFKKGISYELDDIIKG